MTRMSGRFRGAALVLAVLCAIEMAMREIARRSLVHLVAGTTPPVWLMVALPTALVIVARRPAAVLIPLFALGVAVQMHLGARLQSDGFYYYAYLRSMAFDRDVDFTNDYRMLGLGTKANLFAQRRRVTHSRRGRSARRSCGRHSSRSATWLRSDSTRTAPT